MAALEHKGTLVERILLQVMFDLNVFKGFSNPLPLAMWAITWPEIRTQESGLYPSHIFNTALCGILHPPWDLGADLFQASLVSSSLQAM